jgi:hypothetical protein
MAEVRLQDARVGALVGKLKATGVPEHVRVDLRVRFGHVVVGSEAGSGAYRICPPCGDLQSVISTLRSPTPSL